MSLSVTRKEGIEVYQNPNISFTTMTRTVTSLTDSTKTVTAAESGTIFTLNRAAGIVVTLPAASAGLYYDFHIGTTGTSNSYTISAASDADVMQGVILHMDKDDVGTVVALNEDIDTNGFNVPAADDHQLVLNADADGRFLGGYVSCVAITDALWMVTGHLFGDGTATHNFT